MYVKTARWLIVFVFTTMTPVCWGQDEGQADLDKATELQLQVKSLTDVEKVIELCESAIEKGLDEDNTRVITYKRPVSLLDAIGSAKSPSPISTSTRPSSIRT